MLFLFVLYSFFHSSSLSLFFSTSTDSYIFFTYFSLFVRSYVEIFFALEFRGKRFCFVCFSIDLTHLSLKIFIIFVYVATFSRPISLVLSRSLELFFPPCVFSYFNIQGGHLDRHLSTTTIDGEKPFKDKWLHKCTHNRIHPAYKMSISISTQVPTYFVLEMQKTSTLLFISYFKYRGRNSRRNLMKYKKSDRERVSSALRIEKTTLLHVPHDMIFSNDENIVCNWLLCFIYIDFLFVCFLGTYYFCVWKK
jgi:hypothetical protein